MTIVEQAHNGPSRVVTARRAPPARARCWLGVVAVCGGAVWLGVVGYDALAGGSDVDRVLIKASETTVGPALLVVVGALFLAERIRPAIRRPALARAHLVDAGYLALFAVAVMPALVLVQTGFALEVARHARFLVLRRVPILPRVGVIGVILLGIDAANWLAHVANHRSAALWRLHALHHSQEEMSVFTTFRTHPLVHASYLPALLPALVLGAGGPVPGLALVVYGCLVTLPHANVGWTLGPFGRVLVSPAYHRLHHARELEDDRRIVNFGFVLVIWDRLARMAELPGAAGPVATGLAGRPVPVEQSGGGRIITVILAQLGQPFALRAATDGPS